jgi:hypothetical protein
MRCWAPKARRSRFAVSGGSANRLAHAESFIRRALAIGEQSYGPDHPDVAIRLNNLARLLQATNRVAEAEPLMRRAFVICDTSLGPNHPTTVTFRNNLAALEAALAKGDGRKPAKAGIESLQRLWIPAYERVRESPFRWRTVGGHG